MQFELFPFNFRSLICWCRSFVIFNFCARIFVCLCWKIVAYLISLTYCVRRVLIWHFKMISYTHTRPTNIDYRVQIHACSYRFFTLWTLYFMCCEKFCMFEFFSRFFFLQKKYTSNDMNKHKRVRMQFESWKKLSFIKVYEVWSVYRLHDKNANKCHGMMVDKLWMRWKTMYRHE